MAQRKILVHVTHEAVGKIGGIGAVFEGFFTSNAYLREVGRSILISPLFTSEGPVENRLGENSEVLYSSIDGLINTSYVNSFRKIEDAYSVDIVYGRRTFIDKHTGIKSSPEVILIDVEQMDREPVNKFKAKLFSEFGIRSDMYEGLWDYEQYVRLAPVAIATLKAIGAIKVNEPTIIISHEFMGMPTALAAMLDSTDNLRAIFYAHEVATMRQIVEKHSGHDSMFYNVMKHALAKKLYVSDVFGDQSPFYKHALIEASKYCDNVLAVGDYIVDELRFLAPEFETVDIDLVYNGIPAYEISVAGKLASKDKLRQYCQSLLGYKPDFVFTHVTRLTPSKGLWRDLRVLEHIEKEFGIQGKTAVHFILSTEVSQRRSKDIQNMESAYSWPVAHREGMHDLAGGEASFYTGVQEFNAKSRNVKIIFINQFGFSRQNCGMRMPENIEFMDIRKGTDVEFGQSIYEPFGIAQLEPLGFGGICVVSSVCGCVGFIRDVTSRRDVKNIIVADYTDLDDYGYINTDDMLQIDRSARNKIEHYISEKTALEICARLVKNEGEIEEMIRTGYNLARHMSWDAVIENYLLNSLQKALSKPRYQKALAGA